jgi:endonuclease/exonuclease/phosphatase family metal-dependent hydrolase
MVTRGARPRGNSEARAVRTVRRLLVGALLAAVIAAPASADDSPPPSALRFVTLNVLHGGPMSSWTGNDAHLETRLDLVSRALLALEPDVVALQEASWSSGRGEVASRLAGRLGLNHVYAPASMRLFDIAWFNRAAAGFLDFSEGPAVLSRFPIVRSEVHKLPQCGKRLDPRVLLFTELATPAGPLRVFSTHISGHSCHAEAVAGLVRDYRAEFPGVLMGDFNAVESSPAIAALVGGTGVVDAFRTAHPNAVGATVWQPVTAPERRAFRRVDYVFLVPGRTFSGTVVDSRVVVDTPGLLSDGRPIWPSDHYGVLADLSIFPQPTTTASQDGDAQAPAPGTAAGPPASPAPPAP